MLVVLASKSSHCILFVCVAMTRNRSHWKRNPYTNEWAGVAGLGATPVKNLWLSQGHTFRRIFEENVCQPTHDRALMTAARAMSLTDGHGTETNIENMHKNIAGYSTCMATHWTRAIQARRSDRSLPDKLAIQHEVQHKRPISLSVTPASLVGYSVGLSYWNKNCR